MGNSDYSRREMLEFAAKSCLGVSILPFLDGNAFADEKKPEPKRVAKPAKHVIYMFMTGAMSHLDTFDPKPKSDVQGETKTIRTAANGIIVSEHFPKTAKLMREVALVRSIYTETGAHEQGRYLMRTGYKENSTIRHPALGAWMHNHLGSANAALPANVLIGGGDRHPMAGWMPTKFNPVPIGDPNRGLQNTKAPAYMSDARFGDRMKLINQFDAGFRKKFPHKDVKAYTDFYSETAKLLKSKDLKAFDLNEEKDATRDAYGRNRIGQGLLLARRLVENKVRFIEVAYGSWDHHNRLFETIPDKAGELDGALSALLTDLKQRGLLKDTLVVLATEFGRKPKVNQNAGRDHHPGVFSGLFAGGPIKGGQAFGTSDEDGHSPDDDPVSVQDFNATLAYATGMPLRKEMWSKTNRPFTVAHDGDPITKLF